jgi:hypothetical protein
MAEACEPMVLEFVVPVREQLRLFRLQARSAEFRSSHVPYLIVAGFLLWAAWDVYSRSGLGWMVLLFVVIAGYFGIPGVRERVFYFLFFKFLSACGSNVPDMRLRVTVDDEAIVVEDSSETGKRPRVQTLRWEMLLDAGSAEETEDLFWVAYPTRRKRAPYRGMWIPKWAFETEEDCERFRSLLREKLGEHFESITA